MSHWEREGVTDEWYTPKYIFDALEETFDLDVASPVDRRWCSVPAKKFLTSNSLESDWGGEFVWMNPPFGGRNGLIPWLDKIATHGNGIALTPDRTSVKWWQDAAKNSDLLLFISPKVKFIRDDGLIGIKPGNGVTLFAYGNRAVEALKRAEKNGLGLVLKR
ncbi:MAG TPA: DNA N-6-adenine-methyltransferase [Candidatus Kapabacteria bacterium]|nr:DNA N-6-adenine-methyltransferase [Candidatus Kapabacteria bacterium]